MWLIDYAVNDGGEFGRSVCDHPTFLNLDITIKGETFIYKLFAIKEHGQKFLTFWDFQKRPFYKNINISSTNDISRSKCKYAVDLCKLFEYKTSIFRNCLISEVAT